MHIKFLAVAALIGVMGVGYASADQIFYHEGELTVDSPLAYDPYGDYHYELIQFVATGFQSPDNLFWFEIDSDDFASGGWWQLWEGGEFNPDDAYDPPPAAASQAAYLVLQPDVEYDLVLSTYEYTPTPLGNFTFFVNGPEGATFTVIPEPGGLAMLGLMGLFGLRRRARGGL
jgi:MYXO-CTERM domain-containing protein